MEINSTFHISSLHYYFLLLFSVFSQKQTLNTFLWFSPVCLIQVFATISSRRCFHSLFSKSVLLLVHKHQNSSISSRPSHIHSIKSWSFSLYFIIKPQTKGVKKSRSHHRASQELEKFCVMFIFSAPWHQQLRRVTFVHVFIRGLMDDSEYNSNREMIESHSNKFCVLETFHGAFWDFSGDWLAIACGIEAISIFFKGFFYIVCVGYIIYNVQQRSEVKAVLDR